MGNKIRGIKIASLIIILFEIFVIVGFCLFYFLDLFSLKEHMMPEWVLLSAAILVFIDCIYVWVISMIIASLRHKTDLHAAEVIGSDVQEA